MTADRFAVASASRSRQSGRIGSPTGSPQAAVAGQRRARYSQWLFGAIVGFFLATSVAAFLLTSLGLRQAAATANLTLTRATEDLKTDFFRFEMLLHNAQIEGASGVPTAASRFHSFDDRLQRMTADDAFAGLRHRPETADLWRQLGLQVESLRPQVAGLETGDFRGRFALLVDAERAELTIDRLSAATRQLSALQTDAARRRLYGLFILLGSLLAGLIISALVFLGVIVRQFRQSQAARRAMADLHRRLSEAKLTAERASRIKSEFLAHMSHELRTPLNAILGFAEVMRLELLGPLREPRYREYVADIYDSAQHLLSLINDVLDMSRIEAGGFRLHEEPVELAEAAAHALAIVRPMASKTGVRLLPEDFARLPQLNADGRAVRQMLINLLGNAVKFTAAGGEVRLLAELGTKGELALLVRDNGIGMTAREIADSIVPFVQVDSRLARRAPGSGLGLPITKRLIEMHGGELRLQSEPGKGTTAALVFPAGRLIAVQRRAAG
jgi:two-component system, cell cycle sensor histidine kinase PleC